jgi:hypothetical protein
MNYALLRGSNRELDIDGLFRKALNFWYGDFNDYELEAIPNRLRLT